MKIKIPTYFYNDHLCRGLDTPVNIATGAMGTDFWKKVEINSNDPAVEELVDDAAYYADQFGPDAIEDGGRLVRSAVALLKILFKARPELASKYSKLIEYRPTLIS